MDDQHAEKIYNRLGAIEQAQTRMDGKLTSVCEMAKRHELALHGDGSERVGHSVRIDRLEQSAKSWNKGLLALWGVVSSAIVAFVGSLFHRNP